MMIHGLDWYKRKPSLYLGGVQGLSLAARGLYNDLLDVMYDTGRAIPYDESYLRRLAGATQYRTVAKPLAELIDAEKIVPFIGMLVNRRAIITIAEFNKCEPVDVLIHSKNSYLKRELNAFKTDLNDESSANYLGFGWELIPKRVLNADKTHLKRVLNADKTRFKRDSEGGVSNEIKDIRGEEIRTQNIEIRKKKKESVTVGSNHMPGFDKFNSPTPTATEAIFDCHADVFREVFGDKYPFNPPGRINHYANAVIVESWASAGAGPAICEPVFRELMIYLRDEKNSHPTTFKYYEKAVRAALAKAGPDGGTVSRAQKSADRLRAKMRGGEE